MADVDILNSERRRTRFMLVGYLAALLLTSSLFRVERGLFDFPDPNPIALAAMADRSEDAITGLNGIFARIDRPRRAELARRFRPPVLPVQTAVGGIAPPVADTQSDAQAIFTPEFVVPSVAAQVNDPELPPLPDIARPPVIETIPLSFPFIGSIPEPATWIAMILGIALIGGVLRRQRATAATMQPQG